MIIYLIGWFIFSYVIFHMIKDSDDAPQSTIWWIFLFCYSIIMGIFWPFEAAKTIYNSFYKNKK